jgi:hypothetical protein
VIGTAVLSGALGALFCWVILLVRLRFGLEAKLRRRIDQLETAELVIDTPAGPLVRLMVADLEAIEQYRAEGEPPFGFELRLLVRLPPLP